MPAAKSVPPSPVPSARHVSLDDFIANIKPPPGAAQVWFDARPAIFAEVKIGFQKYPIKTIWRWLKQEHAFPCSQQTLYAVKERTDRTR